MVVGKGLPEIAVATKLKIVLGVPLKRYRRAISPFGPRPQNPKFITKDSKIGC
jgi:hypothetical protein